MSSTLPTPENFPSQSMGARKLESEKKEGGQEQQEEKETLQKVINESWDQAQAAAAVLQIDMQGKMQAIQNLGGQLKQTDQQLLLSLIGQGKQATTTLQQTLDTLAQE